MFNKLCLTGIMLLIALSILAQGLDRGCTQHGDAACIDWDRGVVIAEGIGVPAKSASSIAQRNATALRAARLDAARNMLEMIKGINLSASTTMKDAMISSDTVRTQVQGRLFGLRPVGKPKYFSDGSLSIRMEASLRQTIPAELLAPTKTVSPPSELSSADSSASAVTRIDPNRVYTGLVIDARGSGVQPAMSPKIYDENGNELYGSAYVDQEFVQKHGMAGYVKNVKQARENDRVKDSPLVLKALSSSGVNHTDLTLSNADATLLRGMTENLSFLRQARVVIVLD